MFGQIRAEGNVGEVGVRKGSKRREWVQKKREESRG